MVGSCLIVPVQKEAPAGQARALLLSNGSISMPIPFLCGCPRYVFVLGDSPGISKVRAHQTGIALLLLAGVLSLSGLTKSAPCIGTCTLTQRFLRLIRIGEPTSTQLAAATIRVRSEIYRARPKPIAVAFVAPHPYLFTPSPTSFGSSNPFRSPPPVG